MKLDHDLVRQILIQIEEKDEHTGDWLEIEVEGRSPREINYHLCRLAEGGLIDGNRDDRINWGPDGREFLPRNLTFSGHDYLNAIRSDTTWRQVKRRAGSGMAGVTFEVIKSMAVDIIKEGMGKLSS